MNTDTLILRFRDLVTESGGTIAEHLKIIKEHGYVYWGWWAKPGEQVPSYFMDISKELRETTKNIYLFDSGTGKLYAAILNEMIFNGVDIKCPDTNFTPSYYTSRSCSAWLRLIDITEVDDKKLYETLNCLSYSKTNSQMFLDGTSFSDFEGKQVSSLRELQYQERTLWFVNDFIKGQHDTHEILLKNANVSIPRVFHEKHIVSKSGIFHWLSDLHFDDANKFHKFTGFNKRTLQTLLDECFQDKIESLIISGDITWKATEQEFNIALEFYRNLCANSSLTFDSIGICPGNHDVSFSKGLSHDTLSALQKLHENMHQKKEEIPLDNNGSGGEDIEIKKEDNVNKLSGKEWDLLVSTELGEDSKNNYRQHFKNIYNIEPNKYLSMGRKYLVKNQRSVEICYLNSNLLQQHRLAFQGQGFIGIEQLKDAEEKMGWKGVPKMMGTVRLVVLHHNLFAVNYFSTPTMGMPGGIVYDAEAVVQWCFKNRVDVILHGHTHERSMTKLTRKCEGGGEYSVWVVGLGSTGVVSSHLVNSKYNEMATFDFNHEEIKLNIYHVSESKITFDKEIILD